MKIMTVLLVFILLLLAGPFYMLITGKVSLQSNWQTASRDSAGIVDVTTQADQAIVQVYGARAFNWRGLFAVHTWIAVKPADATEYTIYQVIGWRKYRNLPVVSVENNAPDRYWFGAKPELLATITGTMAEKAIPEIEKAARSYPYQNEYRAWPGPNSNTFIAYIIRQVPELHVALPVTAIGKDYLANGRFFSPALSDTGYQFSIYGLLGMTVAKKEGLVFNLLGLDFGIDWENPALKWPGVGRIGTSAT